MLLVEDRPIGTIVGFDETHGPNHINIVIGIGRRQTGTQLQLNIGGTLRFARI